MKKILNLMLSFILVLSLGLVFTGCGNVDNEENNQIDKIIAKQEFLLNQMKSINKTYSITSRNPEEIVLSNYSLGQINLYDIYGNEIIGLNLDEPRTIYHNWYTLEESENGIVQIDMDTITRFSNTRFSNSTKQSKHDRALSVNMEPFNNVKFASLNGEDVEFNNYYIEGGYKILYPVVTNVTQFASSKILRKTANGWNTSHTDQYATYEVLYSIISFYDTSYESATVMEYRFSITTWSPYKFDCLLNYGEVL